MKLLTYLSARLASVRHVIQVAAPTLTYISTVLRVSIRHVIQVAAPTLTYVSTVLQKMMSKPYDPVCVSSGIETADSSAVYWLGVR